MTKPTLISLLALLQLVAWPVYGQDVNLSPETSLQEIIPPIQVPPPLTLAQNPPPPPYDVGIVQAIFAAARRQTGHAQLLFFSGESWIGKITSVYDADSFEFHRRGARLANKVYFRDIASVKPIPPNFADKSLEGVKIAGLILLVPLVIPLGFFWGLSCNFQCS
ncbi:MAG TPA: hypothetical protein VEI54_05500 [Candidatus Limnocylindrales bacterium]|nr:hypothetical protein [Candidatus Limnocylindrales bacterium]